MVSSTLLTRIRRPTPATKLLSTTPTPKTGKRSRSVPLHVLRELPGTWPRLCLLVELGFYSRCSLQQVSMGEVLYEQSCQANDVDVSYPFANKSTHEHCKSVCCFHCRPFGYHRHCPAIPSATAVSQFVYIYMVQMWYYVKRSDIKCLLCLILCLYQQATLKYCFFLLLALLHHILYTSNMNTDGQPLPPLFLPPRTFESPPFFFVFEHMIVLTRHITFIHSKAN